MAINTNFPNVRPSLLLDFANSQQLDPRVTFSRSTTAPYYGTSSVLAEQNLLLQSQDFDNSSWAKGGVSVTANTTVAPDGTTTADTLTGTSTSTSVIYPTGSGNSLSNSCTSSIYIKPGTADFGVLSIWPGSATNGANIWFNAQTGALTGSSSVTSGFTITSSSSISANNGFFRITVSATIPTGTIYWSVRMVDTDNAFVYTNTVGKTLIIWGAQLEQRSSVTAYNATTTSAITNYIPQLQTAPINSPRFDFNPTTGESLGLLIEQSSTNLCLYSGGIGGTGWTLSGATANTTANIAPDGSQTMTKLIESSTTTNHRVTQSASVTTTTYSYSIYAKIAERNNIVMIMISAPGFILQNFNLSTGTVQSSGSFGSTITAGTPTITAIGNGLYRCTMIGTVVSGTTLTFGCDTSIDNTTSTSYLGNGYSGIYIWGAQLEALAFPTSYIATTSAQVTRAVDVSPLLTSGWYNIAQGTFYAEAKSIYNTSTTGGARYLIANTGVNAYYLYANQGATTIQSYDGATTTSTSVSDFSVFNKFGSSYSLNTKSVTNNGLTVTSGTYNQQWGNNTILNIGSGTNGGGLPWNGWIKKIAYYPQAVTSAQLQALTGT